MNPIIRSVTVDGKDIQRLLFDKLMPACEGETLEHSVLAMLCLCSLMMRPDVAVEKLQETVMATSAYLITQLTDSVPMSEAN